MSQTAVKPRTKTRTERPKLYKVILLNDDYTPREFVVLVLKAVVRVDESHAYKVMMTAHRKGACVIAVFTQDVAERVQILDRVLRRVGRRADVRLGGVDVRLAPVLGQTR